MTDPIRYFLSVHPDALLVTEDDVDVWQSRIVEISETALCIHVRMNRLLGRILHVGLSVEILVVAGSASVSIAGNVIRQEAGCIGISIERLQHFGLC